MLLIILHICSYLISLIVIAPLKLYTNTYINHYSYNVYNVVVSHGHQKSVKLHPIWGEMGLKDILTSVIIVKINSIHIGRIFSSLNYY